MPFLGRIHKVKKIQDILGYDFPRGDRINCWTYRLHDMIEETLQIKNKHGLHARPAAHLVKIAGKFKSDIKIFKDGLEVNAKSIMGVMMLAAEPGSEVLIHWTGRIELPGDEVAELEIEVLKTQSQAMVRQLNDIQRRIDELEKK